MHSDMHDQVGSHGERVGFDAQHKIQARSPRYPPATLSSSAWAGPHVDVHDQVGGLGERVGLHALRIVQVARGREELARVPLQQLHALVAVVLPACNRILIL